MFSKINHQNHNKKDRGFLKKIFLAIVTILFIFTLNLFVYSTSLKSTVFNADFYEYELTKFNFYSKIHKSLISSDTIKAISGGDVTMKNIITKSVTEDWIKTQIVSLIRNFFSYINSETDTLDLKISTVEVKENILMLMKKEIPKLLPTPIPGGGVNEELYAAYLENIKKELNRNFPDELDLMGTIESKENKAKFFNAIKNTKDFVSFLRTFYLSLLIFSIALISLIIYLSRDVKEILKRIGASFFLSGSSLYFGNIFVISLVSSKFGEGNLPNYLTKEMLIDILKNVFSPIDFWGIIFMVFGVVLLATGYFFVKD